MGSGHSKKVKEKEKKRSLEKPKTEISKPKTEISKPKTEISKPKTEISKPKTEISKPKIEEPKIEQPKVEVTKPKIEEPKIEQPKVEEVKPKIEQPKVEVKPKVEEVKPKVEEVKPKVEEVKPKVEEAKPKVEEAKPKVEEVKPKVEEVKPVVEQPKPKVGIEGEFERFKDNGKNIIGLDNIVAFFGELGIEEDDIGGLRALWVMWKLGSVEMGLIGKNEFIEGMKKLRVNSLSELKEKIPKNLPFDLRSNEREMKEFITYAFVYNLEKSKQLEKTTTCELLTVFYPDKSTHVTNFMKYLNLPTTQKLRKDEWDQLYDFFMTIKDDFSNYQMETSWPILFDDYVEWKQKNN